MTNNEEQTGNEENTLALDLEAFSGLDIFQSQREKKLAELDQELGELLDPSHSAGLFLLIKLLNELVTSPVETRFGEILLQPLILATISEKMPSTRKTLTTFNVSLQSDPSLMYEPLLNFQLASRWYPWVSSNANCTSPVTQVFEENGRRLILSLIGKQLVAIKSLTVNGETLHCRQVPTVQDAVNLCIRVLSRYLLRNAQCSIKMISRKPAIIEKTPHALKLRFNPNQMNPAEQQLNLAQSPGWIHWLGCDLSLSVA